MSKCAKKSMCVKEKVTTNDKLERESVCFFVSYANISRMHLRDGKARQGDTRRWIVCDCYSVINP